MKKLCTPPNKQIQSEIFGFSNFSRPPPAAWFFSVIHFSICKFARNWFSG
jgi:hypothetical protein